jgi:hypothetical protein
VGAGLGDDDIHERVLAQLSTEERKLIEIYGPGPRPPAPGEQSTRVTHSPRWNAVHKQLPQRSRSPSWPRHGSSAVYDAGLRYWSLREQLRQERAHERSFAMKREAVKPQPGDGSQRPRETPKRNRIEAALKSRNFHVDRKGMSYKQIANEIRNVLPALTPRMARL